MSKHSAEPDREMTFEEMCLDAINQGHRRNVEYLEMLTRQQTSHAWIMGAGALALFAILGLLLGGLLGLPSHG